MTRQLASFLNIKWQALKQIYRIDNTLVIAEVFLFKKKIQAYVRELINS